MLILRRVTATALSLRPPLTLRLVFYSDLIFPHDSDKRSEKMDLIAIDSPICI